MDSRRSSAPALGLCTCIDHYFQTPSLKLIGQGKAISGERLQDHMSSGFYIDQNINCGFTSMFRAKIKEKMYTPVNSSKLYKIGVPR